MNYQLITEQAEIYVRNYFTAHYKPEFVYHNLKHTEYVASHAKEIANHFQLNEKDYFVVIVSAWFHDTGYFTAPENHEQESARLAKNFLLEKEVSEEEISAIESAILATKMPQQPKNILEEIVCDADLYNLGTDDFPETDKKIRKEREVLISKHIGKTAWTRSCTNLLSKHQYHTDYCRLQLNDTKEKNLKKLQEKLEKLEEGKKEKLKKENSEKENKPITKRPDRGIETMFRVTSNNNQRLSTMADNKAHIMITVNSIILSAIISLVLRKLDADSAFAFPTYLTLLVSVVTIIFAILATRPTIPPGIFTDQDIQDKKVNLLFFGNFYKMSLEAYTKGMLEVMKDPDFLYGSLVKDVYSQGIVLGKKYKLLRISYNTFMFGLIVSVIAYIIASIIND